MNQYSHQDFIRMFGENVGRPLKEPIKCFVDCGVENRKALLLSEASISIPLINVFGVGEGRVVINEKQPSGNWSILQVHQKRIINISW